MKHIKPFLLLGLLITLMAMAIGCVPSGEGIETEPGFTGSITEVHRIGREDTVGQVLVEARVITGNTDYLDKYMVTVKDETLLFEQDGGDLRPVTFEALAVGQQVQVWFAGPVKESYPMQVDAGQIVILK